MGSRCLCIQNCTESRVDETWERREDTGAESPDEGHDVHSLYVNAHRCRQSPMFADTFEV